MRTTLHLPARTPPTRPTFDGLLKDARTDRRRHGAAVEVSDGRRTKTMWVRMPTPPETRMVAPPPVKRFEQRDHAAGVWLDAPEWLQRRLRGLDPISLATVLRSKRHGLRQALDTDTTPVEYSDLADKLRRMISDGHLHLRGRTFKVSKVPSFSGAYAVTGAKGTVRYTFEALLDVLREGRF